MFLSEVKESGWKRNHQQFTEDKKTQIGHGNSEDHVGKPPPEVTQNKHQEQQQRCGNDEPDRVQDKGVTAEPDDQNGGVLEFFIDRQRIFVWVIAAGLENVLQKGQRGQGKKQNGCQKWHESRTGISKTPGSQLQTRPKNDDGETDQEYNDSTISHSPVK
jgi:hypothetical protein